MVHPAAGGVPDFPAAEMAGILPFIKRFAG
jgi:hypothetical protein